MKTIICCSPDVHAGVVERVDQHRNSGPVFAFAEKLDGRRPLQAIGATLITAFPTPPEDPQRVLVAPLRQIVQRIVRVFPVVVLFGDQMLVKRNHLRIVNAVEGAKV